MKTERCLTLVVVTVCLCAFPGCQSDRHPQSSPTYSELPPQGAELAAAEVPASHWSREIRALNPIKVYREGCNLVVVQEMNSGTESGKYIIPALSSTGPMERFAKFAPVAVDGFPPMTRIYDYERATRAEHTGRHPLTEGELRDLVIAVHNRTFEGSLPDRFLRRLHAVEVYNDRANMVIALERDADQEQGYYITTSYSSFDPSLVPAAVGVEWTWTPLRISGLEDFYRGTIFEYSRRR